MRQPELPQATILVADDSEANRLLLEHWLTAAGYTVRTARDGVEALDLLSSDPADLLILDVMMPRETGFSVCRTLKSRPETRLIPVILVTALAEIHERIHGIEAGADDYLIKPVNRGELLARVRSLLRLKSFVDELENAETVLFSLARSIEAKDPYTEGHCERLSELSVALASQAGLAEEHRTALRRAGVVHDIGKVAVPEQVLLKPGPLTPEEQAVMRQHPIVGERICQPLKALRLVLPIIRHHHEKMDGSGYPDGLAGRAIPLTARILQTVDVYDALTTDRPYRRALSHDAAMTIMRKEVARGWWDGDLVEELEGLLRRPRTHSVGAARGMTS
jgi:putative two-component system response regulator